MHLSGHLPLWMILTSFHFSGRSGSNYLVGKPECNLPKNLGSTKGVLLIPDMRYLVVNKMACPYFSMVADTLLDLEQPLLWVECFQHLVIFILRLT